jgi:hypothetical protein
VVVEIGTTQTLPHPLGLYQLFFSVCFQWTSDILSDVSRLLQFFWFTVPKSDSEKSNDKEVFCHILS